MKIDVNKVNRLEVINYVNPKTGFARDYVIHLPEGAELVLEEQDGGKTLKIFIQKRDIPYINPLGHNTNEINVFYK